MGENSNKIVYGGVNYSGGIMVKLTRPEGKITSDWMNSAMKELKAEAKRWLGTLPEKLGDIPGNHKTIGKHFLDNGAYQDAIYRFRIVRWMRPNDAEAVALLAKAYALHGESAQAKQTLQELKQKHPAYLDSAAVEKDIQTILYPPAQAVPEPIQEEKSV